MFDEKDVPSNLPTGQQGQTTPPVPTVSAQPAPTLTMPESVEPVSAPKPPAASNAPLAPVEDMFDAVDGSSAPTPSSSVMDQVSAPRKGGAWKIILIIVVAVLLLALIAWGAFALLGATEPGATTPTTSNPTPTTSTTPGQNPTGSIDPIPDPQPNDAQQPDPQPVVEPDGDGDGLTDAEEARYGTAIHKPDTDNDGLFDREEVMVYRTNPLSADTDGDGFLDGSEVSSGYNPNGPGRLLELPTSKD